MATWYVRPLPAGGWQVLTPGCTHARVVLRGQLVDILANRSPHDVGSPDDAGLSPPV